jgi:tRNA threonylcarbamoyladenosine biosynthesis protein TsaB
LLTLAFDSATEVATAALVDDGEVLGERRSRAIRLLEDADALLRQAGARPEQIAGIAVGTGPGSFTGVRIALATARALALALDVGVAGVSTLDVLAAGSPGALPVIDAKRGEVFVGGGEPRVLQPGELEFDPGTICVGDGAVRYRAVFEAAGARIPPDDEPAHVPWARFLIQLAGEPGPPDAVEPIYLRLPDAERALR